MGRFDEGRGEAVKYVHTDGTEYEVAELANELLLMANNILGEKSEILSAAAALIERHERVCGALERLLVAFDVRDPLLIEIDANTARAALRGEEDARREN